MVVESKLLIMRMKVYKKNGGATYFLTKAADVSRNLCLEAITISITADVFTRDKT